MTYDYEKYDNYYFDLYINCIKIQLQETCKTIKKELAKTRANLNHIE